MNKGYDNKQVLKWAFIYLIEHPDNSHLDGLEAQFYENGYGYMGR